MRAYGFWKVTGHGVNGSFGSVLFVGRFPVFVSEGCLECKRDIRREYHDYHTEKAH